MSKNATKEPGKKAAIPKADSNGQEAPTKSKHPSGLSESKLKVLRELNRAGDRGMTRTDLGDRTGIKKGWAKLMGAVTKGTPAEGTLEGDGYVRSQPADEGERGIRYYITKKGKSILGK